MNRINPKKLLNSKWTALEPQRKEKHFVVTEVEFDDCGLVLSCTIEALLSQRAFALDWKQLKDTALWVQGWK